MRISVQHMIGLIGVAVVLLTSPAAFAQTPTWEGRGYVSANGAFQSTKNDFSDTETFTTSVEQGNLSVAYPINAAPVFDVGGGVRVWGKLAVGVAVSSFSKSTAAAVVGSIPHPFFFGRNRSVTGDTDPLERQEIGVHIHALWMIPLNTHLSVAVFGGPTYFSVKQDIVQSIRYSESYPYDTASFTGVNVTSESKNKLGFNAGADVTYMFSAVVGVGGVVRFSRATMDFSGGDGSTLSVDVGGVQAGGGIRLRF